MRNAGFKNSSFMSGKLSEVMDALSKYKICCKTRRREREGAAPTSRRGQGSTEKTFRGSLRLLLNIPQILGTHTRASACLYNCPGVQGNYTALNLYHFTPGLVFEYLFVYITHLNIVRVISSSVVFAPWWWSHPQTQTGLISFDLTKPPDSVTIRHLGSNL